MRGRGYTVEAFRSTHRDQRTAISTQQREQPWDTAGDVIAELTTDHREVEELFGKIEALSPGDEQRKKYADQA
ncbi:hypothetical protein GCM10023238_35620 [Streptomyces heliomycini]